MVSLILIFNIHRRIEVDYIFRGWTVSLSAVGGMFTGVAVGLVADNLGRKSAMLYNNAFAVIAAIIMTSAKYVQIYWLLMIGRFVIGLNSGWFKINEMTKNLKKFFFKASTAVWRQCI